MFLQKHNQYVLSVHGTEIVGTATWKLIPKVPSKYHQRLPCIHHIIGQYDVRSYISAQWEKCLETWNQHGSQLRIMCLKIKSCSIFLYCIHHHPLPGLHIRNEHSSRHQELRAKPLITWACGINLGTQDESVHAVPIFQQLWKHTEKLLPDKTNVQQQE